MESYDCKQSSSQKLSCEDGVVKNEQKVEEQGACLTDVDGMDYNMSHKKRGRCIIFNHRTFRKETKFSERTGTEVDGKALFKLFEYLNFMVEEYIDLTLTEIVDILSKDDVKEMTWNYYIAASEMDYSESDCFACCVLTHGERNHLWAKDREYQIEILMKQFQEDKCTTLSSKPKIFFLQACQGKEFDSGVELVSYSDVADSEPIIGEIPPWRDFLVMHSTVPGYCAWRNTSRGSWFVDSLVSTLMEHSQKMDLLSMLTMVNCKIAFLFESNVPNNAEEDKKKQVSCVKSMLTRRVFFFPQARH